MRTRRSSLLLVAFCALTCALPLLARQDQDAAPAKPVDPHTAEVQKILDGFEKTQKEFWQRYSEAKDNEARNALLKDPGPPEPSSVFPQLWELAKKYSGSEAAAKALAWMAARGAQGEEKKQILDILSARHLTSPALLGVCRSMSRDLESSAIAFTRKVAASTGDHATQGWATYALAQQLKRRSSLHAKLSKADEETRGQYSEWYGKDTVAEILKGNPKPWRAESEKLLEQVEKTCVDVDFYRGSLAKAATGDLFELRNLGIGMVAPEIEGEDIFGKAFALSEYRGKVVVLDFWGNW